MAHPIAKPSPVSTTPSSLPSQTHRNPKPGMAGGCPLTTDPARSDLCRNSAAAARLKLLSLAVILLTSAAGISSPVILSRLFKNTPSYSSALTLIKSFAAGVILSTALVHVLPDAFAALSDCQLASRHPWRDFPFSGLVTLVGALLALLVDVSASSHVESSSKSTKSNYVRLEKAGCHSIGEEEREGELAVEIEIEADDEERLARLKQRMVSQVLEIGIIFHSVIIGVTLGMSQNKCAIRPLVAALAFHQIFEGMGLGGCIAQAGFGFVTVGYMCLMFAVTTPLGIIMGMIIFHMTGYDDSSPNALILEGLLGSLSSGILVYMALVDLIAVDFFHNKTIASNSRLKKASYVALTLGSASMSVLALWA